MIAVVVPTIRPDSLDRFISVWETVFIKHSTKVFVIVDGEDPELMQYTPKGYAGGFRAVGEVEGLIFNKNDGVRNLGFYAIAKYHPEVDTIVTLDDDLYPIGDPIQDHIDALNKRVPVSWFSHTGEDYMRGFPYGIREEAEVVLSHGVWEGVKDWDAPTQLVQGNRDVEFYKGPIPKGVYYPMCGMNIAFKRKMLPYMYFAPMGYKVDMDRFADIWLGITSKRVIDEKGWAVVTGYAKVRHDRASNVWKNLQKEAKGLELNETFWSGDESDPYFKLYAEKRRAWFDLINPLIS